MIVRACFDRPIQVDHARRETVFETSDGWDISEEEPGRLVLRRDGADILAQDHAYALHRAPDPPPSASSAPTEAPPAHEPPPSQVAGEMLGGRRRKK